MNDCAVAFMGPLTKQKQNIVIGDSDLTRHIKYGVSQGSVLGPILFNIYIAQLGDLIQKHDIQYHIYGDVSIYCICIINFFF